MGSITCYDYRLCAVIVWLAFTAFTIYSGSPGVLLTDTIMFLVFLAAALVAVPFLVRAGGGWFGGIEALARSDTMPGILSWAGNPDYLYPDGASNTAWAVTYGIVWALVVAISPWQTSRYLMAKDEHVVLRSSVWSSMGVMVVTIALYFAAAFVRNLNGDLPGSEAMIWAATHVVPPVIGMLLLTLFLKLGWIKLHWVQGMSDFLVANLGFFFIPPGVALMLYFDIIAAEFWPIVTASLISTLLVLVVTGWVHQLTRKIK